MVIRSALFVLLPECRCRYFKKPLNIFLGFIPEIVFMASLFGYLALLVFYKWAAYDVFTSKDAPSLLIHFINMCLFNYSDTSNKPLYRGQVLLPLPPLTHALVSLHLVVRCTAAHRELCFLALLQPVFLVWSKL